MLQIKPPTHPRVPLAPVLSGASLRRVRGAHALPSVLDAGPARLVTSGRIAIALALREMGIRPGDAVLMPAYHSPSMIPPVLHLGAVPVFYRLHPDASPDLGDLAAKLVPRVKALVVTHYFGFIQDLAVLRSFCDAHGLQLLEDCAHSFFGEHGGRPVGAWGDYAAASSMKFYPVYEGGVLVSAHHGLGRVALHTAGPGFEAKATLATLERGFPYGRLPLLRALLTPPLQLKAALRRLRHGAQPGARPSETSAASRLAPASSDSGFGFDPAWLDKRSSRLSRLLVGRLPTTRIVALRRARYRRLEQALGCLPGVRPLFPALPDGVCPWMFPLVADDPKRLFDAVCAAAVPVTRFGYPLWPGVDESVCASSSMLSRHVLAFPCHQELRDEELDWMIATLQTILRA